MKTPNDSERPAVDADPAPAPAPGPSPGPAPAPAPATTEGNFFLTCTNNSTIQLENHFMVYPPNLILAPSQPQVPYPMVSAPTVPGEDDTAVAVMSWAAPPAGLGFLTMAPGQTLANAASMPVELGQTVTVSWVNGQMQAVAAPGGPDGAIDVLLQPGIPSGASVGVSAGPGPVVFGVPPARKVTITLDMKPTFKVRFGTPPTPDGFSDLSEAQDVTFIGPNAYITVGPDNTIQQTG